MPQSVTSPPQAELLPAQQGYESLNSPDKDRDGSAAGESQDADNDTAEDGADADAEGEDVAAQVTVEKSGSVPEFVKKLYRWVHLTFPTNLN